MDGTYNRWGGFRSRELEEQYRATFMSQDRGLATIGISLLSRPLLLFAYSDYLLFGLTPTFYGLFTLRGIFLLSSVLALYLLRHHDGVVFRDRLTLCWTVWLGAVVLAVTATRPPDYLHHTLIDMMILISLYFASPLPVPRLYIAPLFFTAGSLAIIYFLRDPLTGMQRNVIWISYVLGNVLGIFATRQVQYFRREHFLALTKELQMREALESALDNVKRLEGMLPICSNCRKVRGESGEWKIFEVYLREKTDAEFTHGYCPECMGELFPEAMADEDSGSSSAS